MDYFSLIVFLIGGGSKYIVDIIEDIAKTRFGMPKLSDSEKKVFAFSIIIFVGIIINGVMQVIEPGFDWASYWLNILLTVGGSQTVHGLTRSSKQ